MIDFAIRHSDRKPDADDLSPAGVARAELLARMLAESGVRTAYCSDAIRTKRTIEPLQQKLGSGLKVVVVETSGAGGIAAVRQAVRPVHSCNRRSYRRALAVWRGHIGRYRF